MRQPLQKSPNAPNPLDKIKILAEKSGNSFHYKVVNLFKSLGWEVLISPYYTDSVTDKLREIDIIVEKSFDAHALTNGWLGTVNVRLFIECKYIKNSPTVFWLDQRDVDKATSKAVQDTGTEQSSLTTPTSTHHHLSPEPVAKLFTTGETTNQEVEFMFKALNQSLSSLLYYRNTGSIIKEGGGRVQRILCTLNYPLVVCNSFENFFSVDPANQNEDPKNIAAPFQIEMNYISQNNGPEYFLVDVLTLSHVESFLDMLVKHDVAIVKNKLAWDYQYRGRES